MSDAKRWWFYAEDGCAVCAVDGDGGEEDCTDKHYVLASDHDACAMLLDMTNRSLGAEIAYHKKLEKERDVLLAVAKEAKEICMADWGSHSLLVAALDALDVHNASKEQGP